MKGPDPDRGCTLVLGLPAQIASADASGAAPLAVSWTTFGVGLPACRPFEYFWIANR